MWAVGDTIFDQVLPGADRERIGLFSEATEDPNPIHLDEKFAMAAGFATVLQQGPMTTSQFARLLAEAVGQDNLLELDVSFTAPVFPAEAMRFVATVSAVEKGRVSCALEATKEDGTRSARGDAVFKAEI